MHSDERLLPLPDRAGPWTRFALALIAIVSLTGACRGRGLSRTTAASSSIEASRPHTRAATTGSIVVLGMLFLRNPKSY